MPFRIFFPTIGEVVVNDTSGAIFDLMYYHGWAFQILLNRVDQHYSRFLQNNPNRRRDLLHAAINFFARTFLEMLNAPISQPSIDVHIDTQTQIEE